MSRRNTVRTVSFSLCIAIFCLISVFKVQRENKQYILQIENNYSFLLDQLNTATNNIALLLNKARFVTTKEQIGSMASSLLTEAEISKISLSQLPVSGELTTLNRFFSQVGSYAASISENTPEEDISDQSNKIELLSDISNKIALALNRSRESFNNLDYWAAQLESSINNAVSTEGLSQSLDTLEGELTDYPTLIFDGPYSDHILEKEPAMLIGANAITKEEALKYASEWCGAADLEDAGTTDGKIATFDFLGEGIYISVTQNGGYILHYRRELKQEEIVLNYDQALLKATAFLNSHKMNNLSPTYYSQSDGICTVNFAYRDGKTLCYTDLIKVGVSMESGEIVFYEAGGYIANHRERSFPVPQITQEQAAKLINPKLTVNSVQLALIPTDSVEEKRCYEFACTSSDRQEVLVYINTATPSEEEILILQRSDGGILVK